MNQFIPENSPQVVKNQVDDFVRGGQERLAGALIGIYPHGSLALGCFNPDRSDIDLLVVIENGMTIQSKRQIIEFLLQLSAKPAPIEVSFL